MNRRNFLSWLGLGAVAACVPAPIKALAARVVPAVVVKRWVGPIIVDQSGRGDFVDIQSALAALPADGGTIFIRAGNYEWPDFRGT